MSAAEFETIFRNAERRFGNVDLNELFPAFVAHILQRTANSINVPHTFMISIVVTLVAAFSPDVYVAGPGSLYEELIFMFLEIAPQGTNKTGASKILKATIRKVVSALMGMSNNYEMCHKLGVHVCLNSIPVDDNTATIAAGIRKQADSRNLVRVQDEYLNFDRMIKLGGDGVGHILSAWSGESETTYELCSGTLRSVLPRRNMISYSQPTVYFDKVVQDQSGNGFVSRLCPGLGMPNLLQTSDLFELESNEANLSQLILSVAVLNIVEYGSYHALDDDTVTEITDSFSDPDDAQQLSNEESADLFYLTNRFVGPVPRAAEAGEQFKEYEINSQKNERMREKYTRAGKPIPGRYKERPPFSPVYRPPLEAHEAALHPLQIESGRNSFLVLDVASGTEASSQFGMFRDERIRTDEGQETKSAKTVTNALRFAGACQLIHLAGELMSNIDNCHGSQGGFGAMEDFGFELAKKAKETLFPPAAEDATVRLWNKGGEHESVLPEGSFIQITGPCMAFGLGLASRFEAIASALVTKQARNLSPSKSLSLLPSQLPPGLAASSTSEDGLRLQNIVKYVVYNKFQTTELATLNGSVDKNVALRIRGTGGQANELFLLAEIKSQGICEVDVRKNPGGYKFFLSKFLEKSLTVKQRELLTHSLARYDLDTDEYYQNVKQGAIEKVIPQEGTLTDKEMSAFLRKYPSFHLQQKKAAQPPNGNQTVVAKISFGGAGAVDNGGGALSFVGANQNALTGGDGGGGRANPGITNGHGAGASSGSGGGCGARSSASVSQLTERGNQNNDNGGGDGGRGHGGGAYVAAITVGCADGKENRNCDGDNNGGSNKQSNGGGAFDLTQPTTQDRNSFEPNFTGQSQFSSEASFNCGSQPKMDVNTSTCQTNNLGKNAASSSSSNNVIQNKNNATPDEQETKDSEQSHAKKSRKEA